MIDRQRGADVVGDRREERALCALGGADRLEAVELVADELGQRLHQAHVLVADRGLRRARDAAERPVEAAVAAAQGHAEVGADAGRLVAGTAAATGSAAVSGTRLGRRPSTIRWQ